MTTFCLVEKDPHEYGRISKIVAAGEEYRLQDLKVEMEEKNASRLKKHELYHEFATAWFAQNPCSALMTNNTNRTVFDEWSNRRTSEFNEFITKNSITEDIIDVGEFEYEIIEVPVY